MLSYFVGEKSIYICLLLIETCLSDSWSHGQTENVPVFSCFCGVHVHINAIVIKMLKNGHS